MFRSNDILRKQTALKVTLCSVFKCYLVLHAVQHFLSLKLDKRLKMTQNLVIMKYPHLQGERKITVLLGYFLVFMLHISGIYWWNHKDDIFYPLLMVPPKGIPPFWHAIFIILVNGMVFETLV